MIRYILLGTIITMKLHITYWLIQRMLLQVKELAKSQLIKEGIKLSFNIFWSLLGVQVEALHVPDLLHGMYLGLLDYLMQ